MDPSFWSGKRVLLTGHTGFKGSWLTQWLLALNADMAGLALDPPTQPSLFEQARLANRVRTFHADVRDLNAVKAAFEQHRPQIIFHLAAQPLVRESYIDPVRTFSTNIMGTVHVLEAIRHSPGIQAAVIITSDKCYENLEWDWGYREIDQLGGPDPYSGSKGCAELVASSYQRSYFSALKVPVATVRAGNVIGGGDWARFRLVPDIIRSFTKGEAVTIRFPNAVRPWQHVLEPLSGYLRLAELLATGQAKGGEAFNFGPSDSEERPVQWVVERIAERWGNGATWYTTNEPQPHEAGLLRLDSSKARRVLGWSSRLSIVETIDWIADWYLQVAGGASAAELCTRDIARYQERAVS